MVKIAVMGHGVVGSGVVEVLTKNHEGIERRAKEGIEVKYILDLRDFPDFVSVGLPDGEYYYWEAEEIT